MTTQRGSTTTGRGLIGARASALAAEQRGVVARRQLIALGWSATTVDRRIAGGLLHPLWPGVYAFGHRVLTSDGWLFAATLAGGDGTVLAARSAGAARGLMRPWSRIDIACPGQRGVSLDGIRAHRIALAEEERDVHRGLPVTSLARTALDVAAAEGTVRAAELLDRALLEGQYDHGEMRDLLERRRGCRGMLALRGAVAGLGDQGIVFRSRPERLARDLLRAGGLAEPRVNAWFPTRAGHGHELDLWWAGPMLNVELDGPHHELPHQRRMDALRDSDLRSFGVTVVRVPTHVVIDAPGRFIRLVADALQRG